MHKQISKLLEQTVHSEGKQNTYLSNSNMAQSEYVEIEQELVTVHWQG